LICLVDPQYQEEACQVEGYCCSPLGWIKINCSVAFRIKINCSTAFRLWIWSTMIYNITLWSFSCLKNLRTLKGWLYLWQPRDQFALNDLLLSPAFYILTGKNILLMNFNNIWINWWEMVNLWHHYRSIVCAFHFVMNWMQYVLVFIFQLNYIGTSSYT